jgi:hypothetical protein
VKEVLKYIGYVPTGKRSKVDIDGLDSIQLESMIIFFQNILGFNTVYSKSDVGNGYKSYITIENLYTDDEFLNFICKSEFTNLYWELKKMVERESQPSRHHVVDIDENRWRTEIALTKERMKKRKLEILQCMAETIIIYKSKRKSINDIETISASDIASYSFCPASYSIKKSFEIIQSSFQETGTKFHDQVRLVKIMTNIKKKKWPDTFKNLIQGNDELFKTLRNSELFFSGHSQENKNISFSNKDFKGQPDYIFKDKNGKYFVVEEKFRFIHDYRAPKTFYENHLLQLASYMYGIEEPKIDYGFILYWQYTVVDNVHRILKCISKKVPKEDILLEKLRLQYKHIRSINRIANSENQVNFDASKLNLAKCTNCSVALICGHKSGKIDNLKLPYYNGGYTNFHKTELPELLKEFKLDFERFFSDKIDCQICGESHSYRESSDAYVQIKIHQYNYLGKDRTVVIGLFIEKGITTQSVIHQTGWYNLQKPGKETFEEKDIENYIYKLYFVCDSCRKMEQLFFASALNYLQYPERIWHNVFDRSD